MSIEIKNRWDNKVLYTAKTAKDVREAVIEAVKGGADLRGAYLRGADLRGAYLRGAYLRGADLGGADLRDADLRGAYLRGADLRGAYLRGADLGGADLGGADLRGADLRGADLRGAYLRGADLGGADLRGADLGGADLRGAYLRGAKGLNPHLVTPLLALHDQVGPIRMYKLVTANGQSPIQTSNQLTYEHGQTVEVANANTDATDHCGAGINVATLDWCMKEWCEGYRILVVEFEAKDIAVIPTATDGKFRCHRVTVVGEKDVSVLGLGVTEEEAAA